MRGNIIGNAKISFDLAEIGLDKVIFSTTQLSVRKDKHSTLYHNFCSNPYVTFNKIIQIYTNRSTGQQEHLSIAT